MSSILKVDTIQDQSGNNIINESGNVITIGASGDTITVPAGATVSGFTSAGIDDNATSTAITISSDEDVTFTEDILLGDNKKAIFGAGSDLQIYHDGSNSYIDEQGTGSLFIRGANTVDIIKPDGTEYLARFVSDSYNKLYYDGSERFETTSGGVAVTGDLTVDSNALYVKSSNDRVGIGNSNPQNKLDISATTWDDGILIKNTGNFNTGIIADANRTSAGGGILNLQGRWNGTEVTSILLQAGSDTTNKDDGEIAFRTASAGTPTERMRITSAGDLLIGKTSSNTATAGIELRATNQVTITRSSNTPLIINRLSSDAEIVKFQKDGANVGNIGTEGGDISIGTGIVGLQFIDSQNAIRPFNTTTNTASPADNAIDLGRTVNRFKDIYLGGGAFLGGTGTANKLSDYEEGTWTPTVNTATGFSTGATNYTGTSAPRYTKIGNRVFLQCQVQMQNSSGNVALDDSITMTGLPFTPADVERNTVTEYRYNNNVAYMTSLLQSSGTIFSVVRFLKGTTLRNGGSINININYSV